MDTSVVERKKESSHLSFQYIIDIQELFWIFYTIILFNWRWSGKMKGLMGEMGRGRFFVWTTYISLK